MSKRAIAIVAMLCGFCLPTNLTASTLSASLVDSLGDPHAVAVSPGDTFDITVELSVAESLVNGEFRIKELSQSGIFTLDSVAFTDTDWNLGIVLDPTTETLAAGNGYTSGVFGSIADDLVGGIGVGTFEFATISVAVDPLAATGDYFLNLSNLVFGDLNFIQIPSVDTGQDYRVTVPEPASLLLLAAGLGCMLRSRRLRGRKLALIVGLVSVASASSVYADHDELPQYYMDNDTVVTCEGQFYDSGGPPRPGFFGNYGDSENFVKTFIPVNPTNEKLRFEFVMFELEETPPLPANPYDRLEIYDGNSTNAPLIGVYFPRSDGTGTAPGTITSNAPDGSVTFKFVSDNISNRAGWEAKISCVPAYSVSFQNAGQSMWGPGTQAKPRNSDRIEFLTINSNDFRHDRNVVSLAGKSFGAGMLAGVTGDFGFQIKFEDIGAGQVGVKYPVDVTLAGPAQDDFRAGDLVTINTSVRVETESGPFVNVTSPQLKMDLDARANVTANVTAEACVFDCQSFSLFPAVNLGGTATIVGLDTAGGNVSVVNEQLPLVSTPFDIPVPIEALTGIGGNLDTPDMSMPPNPALTTVADGKTLVASGSDQFTTLSMDMDKWILKALGAPPGVQLEVPEIPIWTLFGQYTIYGSYLLLDLKVDTDLHQQFTYSFTPTVHILLQFAQPVSHTVRRNGAIIHVGTSTVVEMNAGDSVNFIAPDDVLDITPTFTLINPTFTTDTSTRFVRSYREKMLQASLRVPSKHIGCFPSIGACPVCTPSFCLDFPGLNFNVGPLIDLDVPFDEFTDTRLFEHPRHQFPMQGFSPIAGANFTVDPEFPPVAHIDGPTDPVLEGSPIPFSAAQSTDRDGDELTFIWNFGDGGTGQGPSVGENVTHAYGDNGVYNVSVIVDDGHGIPDIAHFQVTVLNVDPDFTSNGGHTIQIDEGEGARVNTTATDPGYLDRFLTVGDFGEGAEVVSRASNHDPIPRLHYAYADEGTYRCDYCVTDDDAGQSCDFVIFDVSNAPPTVDANAEMTTQVLSAGSAIQADLRLVALFNDPGTLDTHTARVLWGDGTSDQVLVDEAPFGPPGSTSGANGQAAGEFTHVYATAGMYDVEVCVLDNDGAEGCDDIGVVDVQLVDLAITKAVEPVSATPVAVGSELTYTLEVTNNGPGYAPDTRVVDVLPDGMELVSALRSGEGRIESKLVSDDAGFEDGQGASVAISGDYLMVGAPGHEPGGAVYVYRANGAVWEEHQKLIDEDIVFFSLGFGGDVAIDGNHAVVGSTSANNASGAAFVFQNSNGVWTEKTVLTASEGAQGDVFGGSVSISGNTIAIGSPGKSVVHVAEFDGADWSVVDVLSNELTGNFGSDVSLSGETLAVASRSLFSSAGVVTVFKRENGNWNVEAIITESDVTGLPTIESFAHSIALDGDVLVVGNRDVFGDGIPSTALVFERNGSTWTQQATLSASDGDGNDVFGQSVDVDGDAIAVGSRNRDGGKGAVYLFNRAGNSWLQNARLTVSDSGFGDNLGGSVAVDGATIVGGAPNADDFDSNGAFITPGAAYVFATCPQSPQGTVTCGLGTIANGESAEVVIVARVGCSLQDDPFVSTDLVNNADTLAHALEANIADNHDSVTSTTATAPQGVCGADFTPPIVSPILTGTLGDNGWYTSDVVVTWSTTDPDSPISNLTGCDASTVGFDTGGLTFTCSAESVGGVTSNSVTVKRDATPPSIANVIVGSNGLNGWHTSDVEVSFACSDTLSDIASCTGITALTNEGQNPCVFGEAKDRAGNTRTTMADGIMIDKTPPIITASRTAPNGNGWNNNDVTVSFECIDDISGIANCPVDSVLTTEGASQSVDGVAVDAAGNQATATVEDIRIDKTAPIIATSLLPAANAAGWRNSIVNVDYICTDGLSGVQSCTPPDVIDVEGANLESTGTVIDLAGNMASATESGINIDWTPPTIAANATPPANAVGDNDTSVTIEFICGDDRSGVADCPAAIVLDQFGFGQSATGEVVDVAGNTAQAAVTDINIGVPLLTVIEDSTVMEGDQIDAVIAAVTPYPATTGDVTINWGDDTPLDFASVTTTGFDAELMGAHVFADDGFYNVEVCTSDLIGRPVCETVVITVFNQPPTITSIQEPSGQVEFAKAAHINALFNDLGTRDAHTATINWGEGAGHEAIDVVEAPFGAPGDTAGMDGEIPADHFYASPGDYTGEVCVTDDENETACASFNVTIAPPSIPSCSITVSTMPCTNGFVTVGLDVQVANGHGLPTAFVWNSDNPDGTNNDIDDNDFDDATIQSPTLTTLASTQFNVSRKIAFPDDSGLDPITCEVTIQPCISGAITSWSSVREHGAAGEVAIPLNASKTVNDLGSDGPSSEPRRGGIQYIVVKFDENMEAANATLEPGDISVVDQSQVSYTPLAAELDGGTSGTILTIEFAEGDLPDAATYTIDLAGALRSQDGGTPLDGDTDCVIRSVVGDAKPNGQTNTADIDLILDHQGEGVTGATSARLDINVDGTINTIDVAVTQANLGNAVPSGTLTGPDIDFDFDGDVDLEDFDTFSACTTGPDNQTDGTPPLGCFNDEFNATDLDGDNDVDLRDFANFQLGFGE